MLSLRRCRELLPGDARAISDEQLEAIRQQFYALARVSLPAMTREAQFAKALAELNEDDRSDAEERAAILEFEGGLSRDQAERLALSRYNRKPPSV